MIDMIPDKFSTAGYPTTCSCGLPTPCEATRMNEAQYTVTCDCGEEKWVYEKDRGWAKPAPRLPRSRIMTTEARLDGTTDITPDDTR